jgi:hypothetical protein
MIHAVFGVALRLLGAELQQFGVRRLLLALRDDRPLEGGEALFALELDVAQVLAEHIRVEHPRGKRLNLRVDVGGRGTLRHGPCHGHFAQGRVP